MKTITISINFQGEVSGGTLSGCFPRVGSRERSQGEVSGGGLRGKFQGEVSGGDFRNSFQRDVSGVVFSYQYYVADYFSTIIFFLSCFRLESIDSYILLFRFSWFFQ